MMKRNDGFTLVELMVVILIGSIVTLAASTVLLMCLRMNKNSTEIAERQNTANIVLSALGELAAEKCADVEITDSANWRVMGDNDGDGINEALFSRSGKDILVGSASMMTVSSADVTLHKQLLTLDIKTEDGTAYSVTVFCRLANADLEKTTKVAPAAASSTLRMIPDEEIDRTPDLTGVDHAQGREAFLAVLTAQEGSTGRSLTTGEYFSEWYIGGYEGNPSWNEETPWCACFISWALDQCSSYLNEVPKFAHVDKLMNDFGKVNWKFSDPVPGDVIFFDWIENDTAYPQHVGVVLAVSEDTICTIEGNTNGIAAVRQYAADDPRILGYGILNWK